MKLRSAVIVLLLLLCGAALRAQSTGHDSGYIPFNGGALAWKSYGPVDGRPLLFAHAGFQDAGMWYPQTEFFTGKGYRVITVDLPGHGATKDGPRRPNADSILLTVVDSLRLPKVAIVSLSYGSAVSLEFASRHSERVEKLVMAGPGLEGWDEVAKVLPATMKAFTDLMAALERKDTAGAARGFVANWYLGPMRKRTMLSAGLLDYGLRTTLRNMLTHRVSGWPVFEKPATVHRVPQLAVPVLLLVGDKDMPEVMRVAAWLKKTLPDARLKTFKNVAHMINLEAPRSFNQTVLSFLQTP